MGFDSRCVELAEVFLPDDATDQRKAELAQVIQDAIEDELTEEEKATT